MISYTESSISGQKILTEMRPGLDSGQKQYIL
jgi:hypothetical protein